MSSALLMLTVARRSQPGYCCITKGFRARNYHRAYPPLPLKYAPVRCISEMGIV